MVCVGRGTEPLIVAKILTARNGISRSIFICSIQRNSDYLLCGNTNLVAVERESSHGVDARFVSCFDGGQTSRRDVSDKV